MRINKYVAQTYGVSRRDADSAIEAGHIKVNREPAEPGMQILDEDQVYWAGKKQLSSSEAVTVLLHKPTGFVCSKDGQGSPSIYDLLPDEYSNLKIAGRLDKDSSGLVILSSDGDLVQTLSHPSNDKKKVYDVVLNASLEKATADKIRAGVNIGDTRLSSLQLEGAGKNWKVTMKEGRNRQIRRTFSVCGYEVIRLHRLSSGTYELGDIEPKKFSVA